MSDSKRMSPLLVAELERIDRSAMDSEFENSVVKTLPGMSVEEQWKLIEALLVSPIAKRRSLGLRVVRRSIRDREILEKVLRLSFSVDRLSELQFWYASILARYPISKFGAELRDEMDRRLDKDFCARHLRALEMHKMQGSVVKVGVLNSLRNFMSERGVDS